MNPTDNKPVTAELPTFTQEEVETAKRALKVIIEEDIPELKSVYIAGEICMWNELQPLLASKDATIREREEELASYRSLLDDATKEIQKLTKSLNDCIKQSHVNGH
jgi:hypothetical protein